VFHSAEKLRPSHRAQTSKTEAAATCPTMIPRRTAAQVQDGPQTKQHSRQQGDYSSKCQSPQVNHEVGNPRKVRGQQGRQDPVKEHGQPQPCGTSRQTKQTGAPRTRVTTVPTGEETKNAILLNGRNGNEAVSGPVPAFFVFLAVPPLFLGVSMSRDTAVERVRQAAIRVASSHGLELFDLQFRREAIGWVLRIMVDRPWQASDGPDGPDRAVGIEDCQRMSHDLGTLLDVEEDLGAALGRAYTLEVSSPGLDRPLRHDAEYVRFIGRLAKIVTSAPVGGQSSFAGRLSGVADGDILLTEGRRVHRIPLGQVRRARLEVEF
jgi:ribosome maturation factor RimP